MAAPSEPAQRTLVRRPQAAPATAVSAGGSPSTRHLLLPPQLQSPHPPLPGTSKSRTDPSAWTAGVPRHWRVAFLLMPPASRLLGLHRVPRRDGGNSPEDATSPQGPCTCQASQCRKPSPVLSSAWFLVPF